MNYQFVPISRIFSKLLRDFGDIPFDEGDIVEWCGEALEFIAAVKHYQESVAFVEVKNHQCDMPAGLHAIIQIAKNNCWTGEKRDVLCPANVVAAISDTAPSVPVALDCNGEPLNAYDLAYYRPYFDLRSEYNIWGDSQYYRSCYSPIRLKNHSFFASLVCEQDDDEGVHEIKNTHYDEYTIIAGDVLRFNFKEGSIAIAYTKQLLDEETGYPLIPDNISYTTAITKYINLKIWERQFYNGREGAEAKMKKAESDWHWYCKQATNVDMMPNGIDEHQNLLDQRSYILPRNNRYYGFFGNLAKPENRTWNRSTRRRYLL